MRHARAATPYGHPMTVPDLVVPLLRRQVPVAARVLATAIADDPGFCYLMPDERRRVAELTALYRMTLSDVLAHGHAFVTVLGPVVTGALAVYPPGAYPMSLPRWAAAAPGIARIAARAREHSGGLIRFGRLTAPAVPADSWYVEAVGVRPDLQRVGRGRALVEAALALVDEGGEPSYLETTNAVNVDYYTRFGYRSIRTPVPLAADGPWIVPMRRPANGG